MGEGECEWGRVCEWVEIERMSGERENAWGGERMSGERV